MGESVDVAIVGGGIVGTSVAWQLASRGVKRTSLVERTVIAAGASGRTGAILRRHYSNRPEAMLAESSHRVFRDWNAVVGGECGYVPGGVVVTVDMSGPHEPNIERMKRNIAMQRDLGIEAEFISPDDLLMLQPFVCVDDLGGASYEPRSGYVDAVAATRSMALAAQREGATICEGSGAVRIRTKGGRVSGIETADGHVAADVVICAAGPWTTSLFNAVGIDIPITALRVQVAIVQRPMSVPDDHFVFVDTAAAMFTRPWGEGRTLIGVAGGDQHDPVDPDDFEPRNDPEYPARAVAAASRRIPAMASAVFLHGYACLFDMTPDAHPIIGSTPIDGLYVAAGFSGAGFKKGPAVGIGLAEIILDGRARTVDLQPFALNRFDSPDWQRPWSDTEYTFSSDFGHGL